jgi:hypothetical protein
MKNAIKYEDDNFQIGDGFSSDSEDEWTSENNNDTIRYRLFGNCKSSADLVDIGALNESDTLKTFEYVANKMISIKYFPCNIYMNKMKHKLPSDLVHHENDIISYRAYESDPSKFIRKFRKGCMDKNYIPIGFLPWKLFMADFITVDKEPLYIYQFVPKVIEVIKIVQDICNEGDEYEKKLNKFHEYFPPKK